MALDFQRYKNIMDIEVFKILYLDFQGSKYNCFSNEL